MVLNYEDKIGPDKLTLLGVLAQIYVNWHSIKNSQVSNLILKSLPSSSAFRSLSETNINPLEKNLPSSKALKNSDRLHSKK